MVFSTGHVSHSLQLHVSNLSYFTFFTEVQPPHWSVTVVETLVLLTIFLVSVVGNIGALVLVARGRWTKAWKLGSPACQMVMSFFSLSGTVTITTLAAIGVERLLAVLKMESAPSLNLRRASGVLLLIWLLSAVALLPLSLFSRVVPVISLDQGEIQVCTLMWPHLMGEIAWNAVFMVLGFLLPGASIVISYSKILQIRQRSKRMLRHTTPQGRPETCAVSSQDYKLFRTLLVLVVSFFIMWAPIFVLTFLVLIRNFHADLPVTSSMFFWVVTFTMANSALNPVLYSLCQLRHSYGKSFVVPKKTHQVKERQK